MPTKKQRKNSVVVDQQFLLDLANDIYDPKSRKFLRLCDGKLTNGPDPTDDERPMHCGLGELYYAMTGRHTTEDGVDEDDVVRLAVLHSTLPDLDTLRAKSEKEAAEAVKTAISVIKALKLPEDLEESLVYAADRFEIDGDDFDNSLDLEKEFKDVLSDIPGYNDDDKGSKCGIDKASNEVYRKRSQRVAAQFRKAAKLLPS